MRTEKDKAKELASAPAAAQMVPTDVGELVDLSGTVVRTKGMSGEEGVMTHRGYTVALSALASTLLETCGKAAPAGQARCPFADVSKVNGTLDSVGLRPSVKETEASLPVRWNRDGRATVNLSKLLMIRPFPIPAGQRAHIPVKVQNLKNVGTCLVLEFPEATFEAIEPRKETSQTKKPPEGQK